MDKLTLESTTCPYCMRALGDGDKTMINHIGIDYWIALTCNHCGATDARGGFENACTRLLDMPLSHSAGNPSLGYRPHARVLPEVTRAA